MLIVGIFPPARCYFLINMHLFQVPISECEVEVAKFLFGLTRLNSQDSDATADMFQNSSVPDISTLSQGSIEASFLLTTVFIFASI